MGRCVETLQAQPHCPDGFLRRLFLAFMALFADFIANDKPYYLRIWRQRFTSRFFAATSSALNLAQWPAELLNVDYKKLEGATAIFPPIPYRPSNINLLEPLEPPSAKHWFGTDKLGRDVMAGMIHGSRISLSIGFVAVGIAVADRRGARRYRRLFRFLDRSADFATV